MVIFCNHRREIVILSLIVVSLPSLIVNVYSVTNDRSNDIGTSYGGGLLYMTNASSNVKAERGVWFYSGNYAHVTHSMVHNIAQRNINTIYFSAANDNGGWDDDSKKDEYLQFISHAQDEGIKIYGVTMETPQYIFKTKSELNAIFGSFIEKTKGIFDTYVIDVEPHTIKSYSFAKEVPSFEENNCTYFKKYISMSNILRDTSNAHEVKFIDTIPIWYHEAMKKCDIIQGINALSSSKINIMAYTSTINETLKQLESIRQEVLKPYVVSIKITPGQGDPHLKEEQIQNVIKIMEDNSIPYAIYEASALMKSNKDLFWS